MAEIQSVHEFFPFGHPAFVFAPAQGIGVARPQPFFFFFYLPISFSRGTAILELLISAVEKGVY